MFKRKECNDCCTASDMQIHLLQHIFACNFSKWSCVIQFLMSVISERRSGQFISLIRPAAAAQDNREGMTHTGKTEDRQYCFTGFITLFCHLWGLLNLMLSWKLLLLANYLPFPSSLPNKRTTLWRSTMCGRKPWTTFQVVTTDSYKGLILKILLEFKSIYKRTTSLCKFPVGTIIIFTT